MVRFTLLSAAVLAATAASQVQAGYEPNGYGLGLIQSGTVVNGGASVQSNGLFASYTLGTEKSTTFTIPACQTVDYSRLLFDVYSGTPYKTGQISATLNGQALPTLTIGGTGAASPGMPGDGNPATHNASATCVYGSGFGYWQVAYAGIAPLLKTDGTPNVFKFTISDPTNSGFDGRQYGASLVTIYSDPSIPQTLSYQFFEGDSYLRSSDSSTPPSPVKALTAAVSANGVNTASALSATYTAGYATGHSAQLDQVYFNGTALGGAGNNVAVVDSNVENHTFNILPYLQTNNTVNYSIDGSQLGGTGESSLHADWGLLTVTQAVPEPASLAILALGSLTMLRRKRRA